MKTITRLFLVGLIALGMTACSNEDEVKFEGQAESTVSIRVVPSSNGPVVRAIGNLSGDGIAAKGLEAESAIKTLEVYLFSGESPDGYKAATDELEVKDIATHSGPKTIVVVANCSIIGPVANKTELLAKTKDLPVVIANGLPANGLPMTGMTAEPVVVKPGKNYYGHAQVTGSAENYIAPGVPLKIYRVNARVAIIGLTLELTGALPEHTNFFDALSEVEVAMFNVPKTTGLFGAPLLTSGDFLYGEEWPTTAGTYTAGAVESTFKNAIETLPIVVGSAPYYYVNENSSETPKEQMMIVLRAKPMKDDVAVEAEGLYTTGGYTYYPVWVNATKDGYTYTGENFGDSVIRRNTQYNITLTIKGIGNPTIDPPAKSFLDVKVSVENWKVISQSVIW